MSLSSSPRDRALGLIDGPTPTDIMAAKAQICAILALAESVEKVAKAIENSGRWQARSAADARRP